MQKKFKVIKKYKNFYLTESENGYKECFSSFENKPTKDGYIVKRNEDNYVGGIALDPEKVNRGFNEKRFDKDEV